MAQEALRASAGEKNRLKALNTEDILLKMRAKGVTSGRAYARQVSNLGKYSADAMKFGESQSSVARQIALSASLNTGLNSPAPKPASNPFADMFSGVASFFGGGPNFNGKQNLPGSGSQRGAAATTINNNQKTVNVEAGAVVINGVNDTDLLDVIQNSIQKIFQDAI